MDTLIYIIIGIFTLWGIFIVAGGVWGQLYKDDNTEKGGKCVVHFIISLIIGIIALMAIGMCSGIK